MLLDPSLLEGLTQDQQQEALAAAGAAQRAEERAEQRALDRALRQREEERRRSPQVLVTTTSNISASASASASAIVTTTTTTTTTTTRMEQQQQQATAKKSANAKIVFVSKRRRQEQQQEEATAAAATAAAAQNKSSSSSSTIDKKPAAAMQVANNNNNNNRRPPSFSSSFRRPNNNNNYHTSSWVDKERSAVRQTYLGTSNLQVQQDNNNKPGNSEVAKKKKRKKLGSKKATFRFEWDNTDDTLDDRDPLYAGIIIQKKKKPPNNNNNNNTSHGNQKKPNRRQQLRMDDDDNHAAYANNRNNNRNSNGNNNNNNNNKSSSSQRLHASFHHKPLKDMTARDWRIFRENYEIVVKGGRAPPPLRSFREANLDSCLIRAIEDVMHYTEPTPIQRQSIPIGLERRDLIGIAETGSGKTAAFGVPLLQYILQLPALVLNRVAEDGPLAVVLAPTRELALQIHGEFQKLLSCQSRMKACAVVGGQSIQHQAQELRDGVHVVVGTPGRINDCIEMAYMVLNQCCYVVLDEADRMIDMGFAPQLESILDAMGGLLKSENEQEAYQQEEDDVKNNGLSKHRLTAMFSATMPLEVERIAKRYLRHPAVISIGDQDSGKNARIVQRIVFLSSPSQKESALRKLILDPRYMREKVIVFVNEKKHADGVGRMVERFGRPCVVLHGGKSQEQREENLGKFRQGNGKVVLVATDVAGRGLDIPNVAHIINYNLPSRSIDSYSHRIGRTGRAGKEGLATSLMTDEDEGVMAALKAYLESTGNAVPERLARHPAANANNAQSNLIY